MDSTQDIERGQVDGDFLGRVYDYDLDGPGSPFVFANDSVEPRELLAPVPDYNQWDASRVRDGDAIQEKWVEANALEMALDLMSIDGDSRAAVALFGWREKMAKWCIDRATSLGLYAAETVPASEGGRL